MTEQITEEKLKKALELLMNPKNKPDDLWIDGVHLELKDKHLKTAHYERVEDERATRKS